ncbi:MAG: Origin recognition complex, subunit 1 [Trizodia sp. TS-e1964]|nr:MAG: Origin recognition complex, subunit 1 [Trizodia sp. TS-e1964]
MSPAKFLSAYPSGKISKGSEDYGKVFICRRGCNTRTATYTNDFIWEDIYHGTEEDIFKLIERVKKETKASRKTRTEVSSRKMNREFDDKNYDALPRTPRKRRKLDGPVTPNTHGKAQNFTTPTHKRVISPGQFLSSPFQIARSQLHVSSVPASLPCRETEFSTVYSHLEAAISEGSGSCIYISGTPGTGKTATVREVVSQLNASVLAEELDDFIFVEINGMKITDPHQAYSLLWEALRGDRVSPAQALGLLEREFGHPGPRRVPCVVLMDELDQLVTKNQSVMYNFFNWPSLRHSRLIVLAVANTMDLPERTLSNKISSRLGLTRITFPGYSHEQLIKIIQSRLEGVPGNVVDPDAVQFASRKVAAVSGDARRALDICRRAVEIAELESLDTEDNLPSTPSKRLKWHQQEVNGTHRTKVTIAMIKQAIHEATTSPLQQALRQLPLSSKLFLAAVLVKIRRTGIVESILSEVFEEARRMGNTTNNPNIHQYLLTDFSMINNLSSSTSRGPLAPRVISLREAATMLMESGIIGLEARKGERTGKVRLNVSEEDINLALREDMEIRGLGFSA